MNRAAFIGLYTMKRMFRYVGSTVLALSLSIGSALSAEQSSIERTHSVGGRTARVRIEIGSFDPNEHRIRLFRPKGHTGQSCTEVDGNPRPLGTDCVTPTTEIRRLSVTFGETAIAVPGKLYRDCFNPRPGNSLAVRLADDGKAAFVFFAGSDAAGSYQVVWVLRADGEHSRLSCGGGECSDMGFINFETGFLSSDGNR